MTSCIQHKSAAFLQCASTCDPSEHLHNWMICCIGYICAVSFQCVSACESSELQHIWMICCIGHKCATSPQCELTYAWQVHRHMKMTWNTWCKDVCWPYLRPDCAPFACQLSTWQPMAMPRYFLTTFPFQKMYHYILTKVGFCWVIMVMVIFRKLWPPFTPYQML